MGNARLLLLLALGAFLVSMAAAAGGLYDRFQQTNERRSTQRHVNERLDASDHRQTKVLRKLLCLSQAVTLTSPDMTPAQKARALRFFRDALSLIHADSCPTQQGGP